MPDVGKQSVTTIVVKCLDLAWRVGRVLAGLSIVMLVTGIIWPALLMHSTNLSLEIPGMRLSFESAAYQIQVLPVLLRFLGWVAIPALLTALFVVYQLKSVLATIYAGNPFVRENVESIRGIGIAALVWGFYERFGYFLLGHYIMNYISVPGIRIDAVLGLNVTMLFIGLVILILAEVFRVGAHLQEEQDLTI